MSPLRVGDPRPDAPTARAAAVVAAWVLLMGLAGIVGHHARPAPPARQPAPPAGQARR